MRFDVPPNLTASMQRIDVWLAHYQEIADPALHARYRALLTEEQRGKEFRFYFADDQRRYLVTRAMVRSVLSRYAAVQPADWTFAANQYGRPFATNSPAHECGLRFNVSHTRGLIALAVTSQRDLGIDVERLSTRDVSMDIAARFFAPPEVAELATVPPEQQQERFFEYWTFKESYIKARGMGLSIPLHQFSFHYPHARGVRLAIQPELGDDSNRWSFWQYRLGSGYLLALCAERRSAHLPTVTLRRIVPMVMDEPIDAALTRCSD